MLYKNLHIKKPIGENFIGENLTSTYYDKIKKLRPYNDINNGEKWQQVIDLSLEAIEKTKDLNITIWFIEASIHKDHLEGLNSLHILYDLLVYYPHCYPEDVDKKSNSITYLKENILSWLAEEEILPQLYLNSLFYTIKKDPTPTFLATLDKQNRQVVKKHMEQKIKLLKELGHMLSRFDLNKSPLMASVVTIIKDFFTTLENFYGKIEEYFAEEEKEKKQPQLEITIEYIYQEIGNLVEKGMELDKQDILLYLISKIVLLKKKECVEVYSVLKEDSIAQLIKNY